VLSLSALLIGPWLSVLIIRRLVYSPKSMAGLSSYREPGPNLTSSDLSAFPPTMSHDPRFASTGMRCSRRKTSAQ
jgi:hypothetical protein